MGDIPSYLALTIAWIVAIAQWYDRYKNGSRSQAKDIISEYETRQRQLKEEIAQGTKLFDEFKVEVKGIIENYKTEIKVLQTSNEEKDTHNKILSDMILDKNPEVISLLKELRDLLSSNDSSDKAILAEQTIILRSIKELTEWIQRRNEWINAASIHGEWFPIMVPGAEPIPEPPKKETKK